MATCVSRNKNLGRLRRTKFPVALTNNLPKRIPKQTNKQTNVPVDVRYTFNLVKEICRMKTAETQKNKKKNKNFEKVTKKKKNPFEGIEKLE